MKLSRKIYLYFGSYIFLVLLMFMAVNYFVIERTLHRNARKELREVAESVNTAAETMLDAVIRNYLRGIVEQDFVVLERLYQQQLAGTLTEQRAKDAYQDYALSRTIGDSGYIVALRPEESRIMIDIHPFSRGTDCAFNQGCQDWVAQKNGYNEYHWQNPEDETARDKVGYFRYFESWNWVVGATSYRDEFTQLVNIEDLRPLIESFKVLERGYFFVLDEQLKALIHPEIEGAEGSGVQNEKGIYIAQEMIKHLDDFYYYDWKNPSDQKAEKKFVYVKKLKNFDWYVASSGYVDDITAPISQLMLVSYVLMCFVAGMLVLLTVQFSRSLTRPLNALIGGLDAFYREQKVFEMPFRAVTEVESVGRAIESLTQNLVSAEEEKLDLLTQLDSVINSMPSMLVGVDDQEKVILWNEKAVEYTGLSRKAALQQPLELVLGDCAEILNKIKQALKLSQHFNGSCRVVSENQAVKFFDVTLYPLPAGLQAAVIRIDDITERVQMEESMLQSRKMEAIGQLAGGVAHDFNNLLAGIQNSAYLLERKLAGHEKAQDYLKIIKDASQRAADLTRKLLTFSRKNAKVSTQIHVHKALHETVEILRRSVDKSIEIRLDLQAENDVVVGDLSQLQSTFLNLGINASHAMPDGGMLRFGSSERQLLSTECDQRSLAISPGRYLQIEVEDNGEGIPQEIFDRLFEPFFTTKKQGQGTGLGLWSAYGAVEQHGGDIQVASEEGEGTVFTLLLPLSELALPRPEHGPGAVISGSGTILMVEDEEILRVSTKEMLETMGYRVLLAVDGQEGLELYRQHQAEIDLVLLDMIMPGMGGRECYQELRRLDSVVPVVLVSGFAKEGDLQQGHDAGGRFLAKPYDAATLSRTVAEALG